MLLERTRELSITDELTGLYNRRHLYAVLETETYRSQRYGSPFCMVILDLDGFKEYNDKFGHTVGDTVLKSFALTLKLTLRETDPAFRYGGDEFAIILPSTDSSIAKKVVDRIRDEWLRAIKNQHTIQRSPVGFSAGIVQFPKDAETGDGLIFLADTALFRSKREGGNKSTVVSELGSLSADVLDTATLDQVYALAATVDARDPYTYGHSKRVGGIAEMIGKAIGLRRDELVNLHAAGLLHDIGKVGVPDAILTKPGKLEEHEWRIIKQHSAEGARIVDRVKDLAPLVPLIRHHHEWFNGTGYPDGLKAQEIPLGARIITVADAYDTMTTVRPYRNVVSHEDACAELRRCAGTQFEPALVEAFERVVKTSPGQAHIQRSS
jgi:diguanylate cyclase (GGDEF)-like protein/putative nucleotidyltransferase with HDIG domain